MAREHTPGPWFVFGNKHCVGGPLADRAPTDPAGQTTAGIAMCGMNLRWPDEAEANARLIAAAPELLEACIALQAEAAARGCGLRIADEAIAKAKGSA
jgi:hypothetical protein